MAYIELSTERQIGMDVGPIPNSKIWEYAQRHELGQLFVQQIMAIDRDYLKYRQETRAKQYG